MDTANNSTPNSIITYKGLKKLQEELEDLTVVRRSEIAQKIKEAREQGDLSENAEYDAAKDTTGKKTIFHGSRIIRMGSFSARHTGILD